ncbi:MAG: ABC transporter ATP-binding protein [Anaerococcus vaginalis]|uniref:ABC transporter ATP-binding protein n=1 Tax=Anaerococcus vaginalis TaxID=33037 RepID=UPI002907C972|nr:ABC transporter ATP-binding protein [Anaerococcus vaginalis]MDU4448096.1 ABC transporter ATP-binding protein [Anaerococcus vaginalis]MDU6182081.1 ABC transporter ATP-binding protein [Anaerococcus vaginalis]MDU7432873.1 ABC transporter ATP-binding protein [Anaerococcus vaginalis]
MSLVLNNVRKKFGNLIAVDDISIEMENGLYGLLGTNGAGKTTLMRILCTVLKPSDGKIYYNGEDIFEMDGRYRNIIGYLPQEFGFYPNLSVKDYLSYIASLKGLNKRLTKVRIEKLLEITGMQIHSSKKMKKLSGGMKRRVGIAQALLNDPKILILDEPTAGLDPMERIKFRNLIGELSKDKIVLLSTHIVSDIEAIAKHIFVMKDGKIIKQGSAFELCSNISYKAWTYRCKSDKADKVISKFKDSISFVKESGEYVEMRILSEDKPDNNAKCVEITLEDVFFYYFRTESGDKYDKA